MKTLFDDYGGQLDSESKRAFQNILKQWPYSKFCFSLRHPFTNYVVIPSCLELLNEMNDKKKSIYSGGG